MTAFADRVKDTTTTTGTGTITLANSPPARFRTFGSAFATGVSQIAYTIEGQTGGEFESGTGTYVSATTFSRDKVETSSNGNALVSFSAGTKDIYCAATAKGVVNAGGGSLRIISTSSLCVSDADLSIGSTTFGTDQVALLQSILDLAASGPLLVIWDGAYSVGQTSTTTALRIRSNTTIRALPGCGAILRSAANVPIFRNYNPNVSVITDKNIRIEGGIWNGNGANNAVSTVANGGIFIHDFVGVRDFAFVGGEIRKCAAFAWHGANLVNALIEDVKVDQGVSAGLYSDGIHFNGPCSFLTIRGLKLFNTADDGLAFNADDGYGAGGDYGPYQPSGAITDVCVEDLMMDSQRCGIRLLSGGSRMDRFSINKVRGKTGAYWLVVDNFNPGQTVVTGPGNIGSVSINDVCIESEFVTGWAAAQAVIDCKIDQLSFSNITRTKFGSTTHPSILLNAKANIGQLTIDGYKSYPYGGGTSLTEQFTFASGSQVKSARIANCIFDAPIGTGGYPIAIKAGATVGQYVAIGNQGNGFTDFLSNGGTITNLHAPVASNFMDAGAAASLTPGTATSSGGTATTEGGTATNATGGTPAYAYQWFRSTASATLGTAIAGQTTLTLADTGLTTGTTYYYTLRYTDAVAAVVYSNQFSYTAAAGSSTWALTSGFTEVSASSLTYAGSTTSLQSAKKTTSDGFGGNVQLSCRIRFTGTFNAALNAALFVRGSNTQPWNSASNNCYFIDINANSSGGGVRLDKNVAGTYSNLGAPAGVLAFATDYDFTLTVKAGVITVKCQRVSDGFWMNNTGAFATTAASVHSLSDSSVAAASGEYGVYGYNFGQAGEGITYSNFAIAAAP